jgi:hypothetical protein
MQDRAVLIVSAVLAALALCFGTAWALRDYAMPVFINGEAMARDADVVVGDMMAARFPEAPVGAARCPRLLDLTGGRSARCAIPIGSDELAIGMALRADHRDVRYETLDALFVARDGERTIARHLEERYGERFAVHCPGAAVRVLHDMTAVSCEIQAPDVPRQVVTAKPYADGDFIVRELVGLESREARVLGADVAARREGSITVAGPALERYLKESVSFQARGEVGRRGLAGAAHCPRSAVLHEGTHVRCTVPVADVTLAYDVHFEKGLGLRIDVSDSIAVVAALREFVTRYVQRRHHADGVRLAADVNCGTVPVIAVQPGSTVRCVVDAGTYDLTLRFLDAVGNFTIEQTASS